MCLSGETWKRSTAACRWVQLSCHSFQLFGHRGVQLVRPSRRRFCYRSLNCWEARSFRRSLHRHVGGEHLWGPLRCSSMFHAVIFLGVAVKTSLNQLNGHIKPLWHSADFLPSSRTTGGFKCPVIVLGGFLMHLYNPSSADFLSLLGSFALITQPNSYYAQS